MYVSICFARKSKIGSLSVFAILLQLAVARQHSKGVCESNNKVLVDQCMFNASVHVPAVYFIVEGQLVFLIPRVYLILFYGSKI